MANNFNSEQQPIGKPLWVYPNLTTWAFLSKSYKLNKCCRRELQSSACSFLSQFKNEAHVVCAPEALKQCLVTAWQCGFWKENACFHILQTIAGFDESVLQVFSFCIRSTTGMSKVLSGFMCFILGLCGFLFWKAIDVCNKNDDSQSDLLHQLYQAEKVAAIGKPLWNYQNLKDNFSLFLSKFAIPNNKGGMRYNHQYAVFSVLNILNPVTVILSGVFRGATQALIHRTLPHCVIISIDIAQCPQAVPNEKQFCGENFVDFNKLGSVWSELDKKESTLVIFDDHQSGVRRLQEANSFGFKYIMFDDNYPSPHHDNFSLKQLFSYKHVTRPVRVTDNFGKEQALLSPHNLTILIQHVSDMIDIYSEFPPLNKLNAVEYYFKHNRKFRLNFKEIMQITTTGLHLDVDTTDDLSQYYFIVFVKLKWMQIMINVLFVLTWTVLCYLGLATCQDYSAYNAYMLLHIKREELIPPLAVG